MLAMEHLLGKFIRIFILHPIECQKKVICKNINTTLEFLVPFGSFHKLCLPFLAFFGHLRTLFCTYTVVNVAFF